MIKGKNTTVRWVAHFNIFLLYTSYSAAVTSLFAMADNLCLITLPYLKFITLHKRWHTYTENWGLIYMYRTLTSPMDAIWFFWHSVAPDWVTAPPPTMELIIISAGLQWREEPGGFLLACPVVPCRSRSLSLNQCSKMWGSGVTLRIHFELFFPHHLFRDFSSWVPTFWRLTFVSFNRDL